MQDYKRAVFVVAFLISLSACSSPQTVAPGKIQVVQKRLNEAYQEWKGTPYILGGTSKSGIDCSAFLLIVMRDKFKIRLPRTTKDQINTGRLIHPRNLLPGDLVFFKTGRNTRHAGIIIDGIKFMHASTSRGVMISELSEDYWSKRFIVAKRVL